MAHYLIADVILNEDSWVPEYAAKVHDIVDRHGGKYLSRSANVTTVEGAADRETTLIALLEFPSMEAVQGFLDDPDYAPFAKARQDGTDSWFRVIDDTDATGAIPYLPKAE